MTTGKETELDRLEQIREILTGDQQRTTNQRFDELAERLHRETRALHDELVRRVEDVGASLASQLETLRAELAQERDSRIDEDAATSRQLDESRAGLEHKLTELAQHSASEMHELGSELAGRLARQADEHLARCSELQERLTRELGDVQGKMVDRSSLSDCFQDLARTLKRDGESSSP